MKSILFLVCLFAIATVQGQADKSKRASPPDSVKQTLKNGTTISINYSKPSLKGRTIGKDVEPMNGQVWRAGANEATIFEINKDVKVEGKALPAGKYGLYSIPGKDEWTIIFNKTWKQWGTNYTEADDALRVNVKPGKAPAFTERMTFKVDKSGKVSLLWGNDEVDFKVE